MNRLTFIHFTFQKKICQQDSNLHMASLDVDSLFTNIPVEKTINICVDNLYNDNENPPNIPKHDFLNLPNIATKETLFMLNNKYYKQVHGVALVLMISNLCSIDVISMIYLYCFLLLIMQINLGSICHLNIQT